VLPLRSSRGCGGFGGLALTQGTKRGLPAIPILLAVLVSIAFSGSVQAHAASSTPPTVRKGAIVSAAVHHDVSARLSEMIKVQKPAASASHPARLLPHRAAGDASADRITAPTKAPAVPATVNNFDGVGMGFGTFSVQSAPPDTNATVGPNHIVEMVNTSFAVFSKTGVVLAGPTANNTIWSGFGGGCQTNNDGDGTVRYDALANRWVVQQFSVRTTPYLECFAVSTTADPTGTYNRYSFQYTNFPDYPKMSVWPDAYYITFNQFTSDTGPFVGGLVCAYDRGQMLQGLPASQQCFDVGPAFGGLLTSDLDGSRLPPAGSPNFVLALDSPSSLVFWKFHIDWTTPGSTTLTGPTIIPVTPFAEACAPTLTCIPQSGTSQQLDSLGDRLMYRLAYRNFGDHEALVASHSVTAGTSTGVRWYEIRTPGATPTLFQQGTYAPDGNFRWMPSIAMDTSGDMALGFSLSGSSLHPAIHYTGRLPTDAAGVMGQGEGTIIDGGGSQTGNRPLSRWGDYSSMAIDPTDDCTFWFASEYINTDGIFNWHTRLANFKFPNCMGPYVAGAVGTDNGLWVLNSGAARFMSEGGVLLGAPAIVAVPQSSGLASPLFFATGADHNLYVRNDAHPWQGLNDGPFFCLDNPAGAVIGGTLYMACQGQDHHLWHAETPAPSGTNLPSVAAVSWQSLGGGLVAGPAVSNVAGKPTYFVIGNDQHVYSRDLTSGFTGYPWTCVGHPGLDSRGTNSYFACHGADGGLWYATNSGAGWSSPQSLGGAAIDGVAVAALAAGPVFFIEGLDGGVWHRSIASSWIPDGGQVKLGLSAASLSLPA